MFWRFHGAMKVTVIWDVMSYSPINIVTCQHVARQRDGKQTSAPMQ
jgi:hypothetical protein